MRGPYDLTRWNRAGLGRFRYLDGNAVTYLEALRDAWKKDFEEWEFVQRRGERTEDLLARYRADSKDTAWLLGRVLSRAAHVLGEHLDAYANESFLGTATQWESARKLLALVDARPRPPVSARTRLAMTLKPGKKGWVGKGLAVKHDPPDGGMPVVFETLEDVEMDAAWNRMRPKGWDRNDHCLRGREFTLAGKHPGLAAGQPLVLEDERTHALEAHLITSVRIADGDTHIGMTPRPSPDFLKGWTWVHILPEESLALRETGKPLAVVGRRLAVAPMPDERTGYEKGEPFALVGSQGARFVVSDGVVDGMLKFKSTLGVVDTGNERIHRLTSIDIEPAEWTTISDRYGLALKGDWTGLNGKHLFARREGGSIVEIRVTGVEYIDSAATGDIDRDGEITDKDTALIRFRGWTHLQIRGWSGSSKPTGLWSVVDASPAYQIVPVAAASAGRLSSRLVTDRAEKAGAGDLAVLVQGRTLAWNRVTGVLNRPQDSTSIWSFGGEWMNRGGPPWIASATKLYSHFKTQVRFKGWDRNEERFHDNRITLEDGVRVPTTPRWLSLEIEDGTGKAWPAYAVREEGRDLILDRPIPSEAARGNLWVCANVALAGHGETKPEATLIPPSPGRPWHSLKTVDVAHIPQSEFPAGVAPEIVVRIGERTYRQVPHFRDCGPGDPVYTTQPEEDGKTRILFGDGVHGMRPPEGTGEVRATYRSGNGLRGNLAPGSIIQMARPHELVEKVCQPFPSEGGNDGETLEELKETGPLPLRTLGYAVSLQDFRDLALTHASVWDAALLDRPDGWGRDDLLEVVIVPAGGGDAPDVRSEIQGFLARNAVPGIRVEVTPSQEVPVKLSVILRIKTGEFQGAHVAEDARKALAAEFALRRRKLGRPFRSSEVYRVLEGLEGIENCFVGMEANPHVATMLRQPDGMVREISVRTRQVAFLKGPSDISVTVEEYVP